MSAAELTILCNNLINSCFGFDEDSCFLLLLAVLCGVSPDFRMFKIWEIKSKSHKHEKACKINNSMKEVNVNNHIDDDSRNYMKEKYWWLKPRIISCTPDNNFMSQRDQLYTHAVVTHCPGQHIT